MRQDTGFPATCTDPTKPPSYGRRCIMATAAVFVDSVLILRPAPDERGGGGFPYQPEREPAYLIPKLSPSSVRTMRSSLLIIGGMVMPEPMKIFQSSAPSSRCREYR